MPIAFVVFDVPVRPHARRLHTEHHRLTVPTAYQRGGLGIRRKMHLTPPAGSQAVREDGVQALAGGPMIEDLGRLHGLEAEIHLDGVVN